MALVGHREGAATKRDVQRTVFRFWKGELAAYVWFWLTASTNRLIQSSTWAYMSGTVRRYSIIYIRWMFLIGALNRYQKSWSGFITVTANSHRLA